MTARRPSAPRSSRAPASQAKKRRAAATRRPSSTRPTPAKTRTTRASSRTGTTHGERVVESPQAPREITVRTLVLFVVVLMAFIVAAPTLRSYVRQQEEHRELAGQIETVKEHNARLQQQVKQWEDPTYVQAQARDRLGFVMPGETPYRVVDPQVVTGEKVDDRSRDEKAPVVVGSQAPWYVSVWDSIQMAGEVDQ